MRNLPLPFSTCIDSQEEEENMLGDDRGLPLERGLAVALFLLVRGRQRVVLGRGQPPVRPLPTYSAD